jgi:hypothetical protein
MNVRKKLSTRLCALAGADTVALNEHCPDNEKIKWILSAVFNFCQSIVSTIAMVVTFFSINKNVPVYVAIPVSILIGTICFLINLGLTSSFSKKRNFMTNFVLFVVRVVITIIISLFSSQVLELYVFKDSFDYARRRLQTSTSQTLQATTAPMYQELATLKDDLDDTETEIQNFYTIQNSLFASDEILAVLVKEQENLRSQLTSLSNQYSILNNQIPGRIASHQEKIRTLSQQLDSLNSSYDESEIEAVNLQIRELRNTITQENNERNRRDSALNNLRQSINAKENEIKERRRQIDSRNQSRIDDLATKQTAIMATITNKEAEIANFSQENENAISESFLTDGLINNILVLDYIQTWADGDEQNASYIEKALAKKTIFIHYLIMAFFLTIDLSPMLVLLFAQAGIYEIYKKRELEEYEMLRKREFELTEEKSIFERSEKMIVAKAKIQADRIITVEQINSEASRQEIEIAKENLEKFLNVNDEIYDIAIKKSQNIFKEGTDKSLNDYEIKDADQFLWRAVKQTREHTAKVFQSNQDRVRKNSNKFENDAM